MRQSETRNPKPRFVSTPQVGAKKVSGERVRDPWAWKQTWGNSGAHHWVGKWCIRFTRHPILWTLFVRLSDSLARVNICWYPLVLVSDRILLLFKEPAALRIYPFLISWTCGNRTWKFQLFDPSETWSQIWGSYRRLWRMRQWNSMQAAHIQIYMYPANNLSRDPPEIYGKVNQAYRVDLS